MITQDIIRLSESHERLGTASTINVLDVLNTNFQLQFSLAYKIDKIHSTIDTYRFVKSLETTIQYYPEFTGSFYKTKKKTILTFDNTGAEFSVFESEMKLKDAIKKENRKLFLHELNLPVLKNTADKLLKIKMTLLKGQSYVLGFTFHHSVCDGWSTVWFLNVWSSFYRQGNDFQLPNNNVSSPFGSYRSSFIEGRCLLTGYDDEKSAVPCPVFRLEKGKISSNFLGDTMLKLLVSKPSLSHFKDAYQLKKKEGDPDYISTTDIVTAIISKALVKARQLKLHEVTLIAGVHNSRKKLNLDDSYLGNAGFPFSTKFSVMDLLELNILDTALLIRKEINNISPDWIKSKLTYFEQADDWNLITSNLDLSEKDFIVSSWETFPLFDVEFDNKPDEILYNYMGRGFLWIFPTKSKYEISLHICLTRNEIKTFLEDEHVKRYFKVC